MELTIIIIGIIIAILLAVLLVLILNKNQNGENQELLDAISRETARQQSELRQELSAQTQTSVSAMGVMLERRLQSSAEQTERQLEVMRITMEKRLDYIQEGNSRQLDVMRRTVDEKLGKTLEEKMNRSFSLVSTQLEQVYKGLGEMQTLAVGVGDLKKVLSNVKTRGILGELQLGAILSEVLSPSTPSSPGTPISRSERRLKAETGNKSTPAKKRCSAHSEAKRRIFTTSISTRRTQLILPFSFCRLRDCTARSSTAEWSRSCSAGIRSLSPVRAPSQRCSTPCRWASGRWRYRSAARRYGTSCAA